MDRIRQGNDGYAPIVLPEKYDVVGNDGTITLNSRVEEPQAASRAIRQEKAWDWVWARRVTYFLTVFASLFLVAQPLVEKWRPGRGPASPAEVVVPIIDLAGAFFAKFCEAVARCIQKLARAFPYWRRAARCVDVCRRLDARAYPRSDARHLADSERSGNSARRHRL